MNIAKKKKYYFDTIVELLVRKRCRGWEEVTRCWFDFVHFTNNMNLKLTAKYVRVVCLNLVQLLFLSLKEYTYFKLHEFLKIVFHLFLGVCVSVDVVPKLKINKWKYMARPLHKRQCKLTSRPCMCSHLTSTWNVHTHTEALGSEFIATIQKAYNNRSCAHWHRWNPLWYEYNSQKVTNRWVFTHLFVFFAQKRMVFVLNESVSNGQQNSFSSMPLVNELKTSVL